MKKIKISDKKKGFLSFDLYDILIEISDYGNRYNWAILDIEATAKNDSNLNILKIESRVDSKENLFTISFDELEEFAKKTNQVINGVFVASEGDLHKIYDIKTIEEQYDIVIEVFDSSYWTIYSNELSIVRKLRKVFNEVEIIY